MEIWNEPPPTRTAVKSRPSTTAQKSVLSSRKLLGEIENGTVRQSTGKILATPATNSKTQNRVQFDFKPAEDGHVPTATPKTPLATKPVIDWSIENDEEEYDEVELPAGRTYLEQVEHERTLIPEYEEEALRILRETHVPGEIGLEEARRVFFPDLYYSYLPGIDDTDEGSEDSDGGPTSAISEAMQAVAVPENSSIRERTETIVSETE